MLQNNRVGRRPRSRLASVEIQFAYMLVDICKTELGLGDLAQANRALSDARASAELIADMAQTRGVAPTVRTKLSKLAKTIDLAERALSDAYNATAFSVQEPLTPTGSDTPMRLPVAMVAAAGR